MLKILLITLNSYGGMVHYTSQLANSLSGYCKVYMLAPEGVETKLISENVHLVQLHTGNIIKNFIKNTLLINRMVRFLNCIKVINPDVIHIQSPHLWLCLFLPLLRNYKIITTIHDIIPHPGSRIIEQVFSRNIHIKYSDVVIVHGKNPKKKMESMGFKKNIYVIPHGDYSFFTDETLENCVEEPGNILFFGRIEDYKGLKYLIEAMPKIEKIIPNIKIVIAGSGRLEDYNVSSEKFEIHNYYIPENEVGGFFQRAAVVVLPYIEGTQTGIIPIAYAFKKPVVATSVGAIPEVIDEGKTGFIVPPGNSDALAEAIITLIKNDELRIYMGRLGYEKMKEELSWDRIAEMTIKVYNKVLNSKENK